MSSIILTPTSADGPGMRHGYGKLCTCQHHVGSVCWYVYNPTHARAGGTPEPLAQHRHGGCDAKQLAHSAHPWTCCIVRAGAAVPPDAISLVLFHRPCWLSAARLGMVVRGEGCCDFFFFLQWRIRRPLGGKRWAGRFIVLEAHSAQSTKGCHGLRCCRTCCSAARGNRA